MKKRVLVMLMIAVMGTMTACGSEKTASVDDVKFDDLDLKYSPDGATYNENLYYSECFEGDEPHVKDWSSLVEIGSSETYPVPEEIKNKDHMDGFQERASYHSFRREKETFGDYVYDDVTWEVYYDAESSEGYKMCSEWDKPLKSIWSGSIRLDYSIFDLPWTLSSETKDEFVFELQEEPDLKEFLDEEIYDFDDDITFQIEDWSASYVYDRHGKGLTSAEIHASGTILYESGTTSDFSCDYTLQASDMGSTEVVIPDEILELPLIEE